MENKTLTPMQQRRKLITTTCTSSTFFFCFLFFCYIMKTRKKRVFKKADYHHGDGMLTKVWGPSLWHTLHTISFNYPIHPLAADKKQYRNFILSLQHVLPCKHCRNNLKHNFEKLPLHPSLMESRETFSRYIYDLHEHINKMLGKPSGLSYCDFR